MVEKSRSPIRDKPLRLPGQSLAKEREELVENAVGEPALLATFMIVLAGLEWWRFYSDMKPNPILFTGGAVVATMYAAFRVWRALPRIRNLKQGMEGERAVGQFLERLREDGYQVFHDVVGDNFNVDHVLIGPAGVFTIETKTWSKPRSRNPELVFDGESIRLDASTPDRDPIVQARAQARWMRFILAESTGRQFHVRPVIAFPGWFIQQTGASADVWVLEPKALRGFLSHESPALSREDIKLASFHLSRLIRTTEQQTS